MTTVCSWSRGKDSCLALHLAAEAGMVVDTLLPVFEDGADRSRSHALPQALLAAQAEGLGCRLVGPRADGSRYEPVFVDALCAARTQGATDVICDDIDLPAHREWEEKVCAAAGLAAHLPLWNWPRARVVEEILGRGIEAVCVCVKTRHLPKEFVGRRYDAAFLKDLPATVDACGENGEFHVTAAPRFRRPVSILLGAPRRYLGPAEFGGDEFWFAAPCLA